MDTAFLDSSTAPTRPDPREVAGDLGLDPAAIRLVETLSERHGHAIWRIETPERFYILKWLPAVAAAVEVQGYLLLQQIGVPTLTLYGHTAQALLLEDLARSDRWRLAGPDDVTRPEVGRAVAGWYRILHGAGEALLSQGECPAFLRRETDELTPDSILAAGRTLGLDDHRVWALAAGHIELLQAAAATLSVTLNYNDFHWTNLALSRAEGSPLEAITFDYHLLGIGMRYSDCRNVSGSLAGRAVPAFWDGYGEIDPREVTLDRPLATLHGLVVASRLAAFPRWAEECREQLLHGELEKGLLAAIAWARARVPPAPPHR